MSKQVVKSAFAFFALITFFVGGTAIALVTIILALTFELIDQVKAKVRFLAGK